MLDNNNTITSVDTNWFEPITTKYSFWQHLKFINLLHCLAQNLIKEIIWNSNEIEIKTTADLVEELLWLLKYMTLNQFERSCWISCDRFTTQRTTF